YLFLVLVLALGRSVSFALRLVEGCAFSSSLAAGSSSDAAGRLLSALARRPMPTLRRSNFDWPIRLCCTTPTRVENTHPVESPTENDSEKKPNISGMIVVMDCVIACA